MKRILSANLDGLPPTANLIYRSWGHKPRIKTPATWQWQERTAATLAAIWHQEPITDDVAVSLVFMTKDRRRWDIDNRLKALLDTLTMAKIIKDDSQIKQLSAKRVMGEDTKTTITVEEWGE